MILFKAILMLFGMTLLSFAVTFHTNETAQTAGYWLAFASDRSGHRDIYRMNFDGSDLRQLTTHPAIDDLPRWSPDGRWIAFLSSRNGSWNIYRMRADGSLVQQLTAGPGFDADLSWSPDSRWIAFASNRSGNYEIYRMRADGSDVRQLTTDSAWDYAPLWSPDGRWLIFLSNRSGNHDLYRMRVDGHHVELLIPAPRLVGNNRWALDLSLSPDGSRLAYSTNRTAERTGDIKLQPLDGASSTRLGEWSPAWEANPVWSADGQWIAFSSDRAENHDIYRIHPDGSGLEQLTAHPSADVAPTWSPSLRPLSISLTSIFGGLGLVAASLVMFAISARRYLAYSAGSAP